MAYSATMYYSLATVSVIFSIISGTYAITPVFGAVPDPDQRSATKQNKLDQIGLMWEEPSLLLEFLNDEDRFRLGITNRDLHESEILYFRDHTDTNTLHRSAPLAHRAVDTGRIDIIHYLAVVSPEQLQERMENHRGLTPLLLATYQPSDTHREFNWALIRTLIRTSPEQLRVTNFIGRTPFHEAADAGRYLTFRTALESGGIPAAEIQELEAVTDRSGNTPSDLDEFYQAREATTNIDTQIVPGYYYF